MTTAAPRPMIVPLLGHWAARWDRLVDSSPLPSPFLRSWWLSATAGPDPSFVLVLRGERLLGGLPLERQRRLGLPVLTMMGAGPLCPDHLDLVAAPGEEAPVIAALSAWLRRPGSRVLACDGVAAEARMIGALPGPVRRETRAVAPWASLPSDPAAYLAARPARFRKNLRRASSRLATEGVAHQVHRGEAAVRSLGVLRKLHYLQWGARSRFLPSFGLFTAGCRLGAEADEIAVHELYAGETVIASMVVFEVANRVSLYQSARRTEVRWRDATTVLLAAVITDACRRGFTEVDFLRGDEAYKNNFAPERRELVRVTAASNTAGRTALAGGMAARRAWQLAERHGREVATTVRR
jgi:CelD/BcsL family acetyltransferase involved in cellulose biosynthesis